MQLSRIESLLGANGLRRVIGMLGQDERKRFYLEDFTSRIIVDLTNAVYTKGLFTVNCVVLVEGEVVDDVLHVQVRIRFGWQLLRFVTKQLTRQLW